MINILHLVQSRGMRSAWRRPQPIVQPPGISHLTLIEGGAAGAAPRRPRRTARRARRPAPAGSSSA